MVGKRARDPNRTIPIEDYEHSSVKRTNNPPVGLAHLDRDETPVRHIAYDPHLDPQLMWSGKVERESFAVAAPSIHVHEELSAQKIVGSVRRQRLQMPLFDVSSLDPAEAVEFYQHDLDWSNRMILGDSLTVMTSLLERERMAGKVQCVFIDPPYGVKYNSNFQPKIGDRAVKDGADDSLTREPEMIQAYRDTWELGIHSYLTYMRDRLLVVRELLTTSGSVIVQISEDNAHLVRTLLDEVFGAKNFMGQIVFTKTTGLRSTQRLATRFDYLVWYARDAENCKLNRILEPQDPIEGGFTDIELPDGTRRPLTREEKSNVSLAPGGSRFFTYSDLGAMGPGSYYVVKIDGKDYIPSTGWWRVPQESMKNLLEMGRVVTRGKTLRFIRYYDEFPYRDINNLWDGFGGAKDKRYVVQTNVDVIKRCILLTSQPGDLILDPTCGGGTTATAAEELGRRWITIDTSRVALAIARERLLTSTFPYFRLLDPERGVDGGFVLKIAQRQGRADLAKGLGPEEVPLVDQPETDSRITRVSGPFTVEALSRYAVNPSDDGSSADAAQEAADETNSHIAILLAALKTQGIPRPGAKPSSIESLTALSAAGPLQAEGLADLGGKRSRFAVSIGPKFGAITMAQVSDALREAIGFDLIVFAGFAVSADAQERLATGKLGGTQVSLLLANPDLLVGDLLKNTKASQTFRLYSAPDVRIVTSEDGNRVSVEGVDTFDAATGDVVSYGKAGVQAWFLDDDYDGNVFRASQAFFPVTDAWKKLQAALRGTVDADLLSKLHGWTSLPFRIGDHGKVAVRVIAQDGNASEVVMQLDATSGVEVS
jgi:adenine-specific DNA-methyltransferase